MVMCVSVRKKLTHTLHDHVPLTTLYPKVARASHGTITLPGIGKRRSVSKLDTKSLPADIVTRGEMATAEDSMVI